ncbi:hypothetical protein M0805_003540 [Coniferiporia weirii]|nr:hypothetical protein M0805_003540 [Coniferiporia weirii]
MFPNHILDDYLYSRLLTLEDELHDAVEADPKAMKSFLEHLSQLQLIASQGIAEKVLTARTLALARSVASSGIVLADHYLKIRRANAEVEKRRQAQLVSAFGRMSLSDSSAASSRPNFVQPKASATPKDLGRNSSRQSRRPPPHRQSASPVQSQPSAKEGASSPSHPSNDAAVAPSHSLKAYSWLLRHLHNPYPSNSVKTMIAEETGSAVKTVNEWFIHIRKKIGWTSIVKRFFKGDRSVAVDYARSVLLGERSAAPIAEKIADAFMTMKSVAEKLFDDRFETSRAAKQLDDLVKDATTGPSSQPRTEKKADATVTKSNPRKRKVLEASNADAETEKKESEDCERLKKRNRNASVCLQAGVEPVPSQNPLSPDTVPSYGFVENPVLVVPNTPHATSSSGKRRLSQSDEGETLTSKRARLLEAEQDILSSRVDEADSCVTTNGLPAAGFAELDGIWSSFNFEMPICVALGEVPEGDLDLNAFGFPAKNPAVDLTGLDGLESTFVQSPAGSTDVGEDSVYTTLRLRASDESSLSTTLSPPQHPIIPLGFPAELTCLPSITDLTFGLTEAEQLPAPNCTGSPLDLFFFGDAQSSLLPDMNCWSERKSDNLTPTMLHTVDNSVPSLPFVQDFLLADNIAKMDRLRQLRDERRRLAEEESRLEQDLRLSQVC